MHNESQILNSDIHRLVFGENLITFLGWMAPVEGSQGKLGILHSPGVGVQNNIESTHAEEAFSS
jgi:hypothetical protein